MQINDFNLQKMIDVTYNVIKIPKTDWVNSMRKCFQNSKNREKKLFTIFIDLMVMHNSNLFVYE